MSKTELPEIQNRQGSEGKRVSKIISEADGAAVQVSPLCIRICGYVYPARRERLYSSFFRSIGGRLGTNHIHER